MREPVIAADGHTYERASIAAWLAKNNTSPNTGAALRHKELTPNHSTRGHAQRFIDECHAVGIDPYSLSES